MKIAAKTILQGIKTNWLNLRKSCGVRIAAIVKDAQHQYSCFLQGRTGKLSSFFLRLFFSGIRMGPHTIAVIKDLPPEASVVYVTKHKNHFEHLFYHTRFRQEGLPIPELALDYRIRMWQSLSRMARIFIFHLDYFAHHFSLPDPYGSGYIQRELTQGRCALFSLIDDDGFYRRLVRANNDPTQSLIMTQQDIDRPIFIVPLLFFYGKKPEGSKPTLRDFLFGSATKPGKIRRLIILINRADKIKIEVSEPLDLQAFLGWKENKGLGPENQALQLRRHLLDQMNRHRQGITGPYLKSKIELKQSILTADGLQAVMRRYGEENAMPIEKVRRRANAHLESIAARYNPVTIRILAAIVKWITTTIFDGVTMNHDGLNRIKVISHKGPIVFIPCHKSHIDYLILSYILWINNMPCPHVAAGDNLSFFPLGVLFRGAGAFFIRRFFRGAVLYSAVFGEYIYRLLAEGFNIEFFIEGGRSRTGKLILPKLGLLSILLEAFRQGACEDMIFAPVFVGYDRVLEERSYLDELEGGEKDPENFSQVFKARRFLKKRYGKIYINFHEPISLRMLLSQSGSSVEELQQMNEEERGSFCRNLGFRVINAIDRMSVVTPHALVAGAILNCSKARFSFHHLMSHIETYMTHLDSQHANLADTLAIDPEHATRMVLDDYCQNRYIEKIQDEKGDAPLDEEYVIADNRRPVLEYYKNGCVIFFMPAAFTALSILESDTFEFSPSDIRNQYIFLQKLFKNEFAFDVDKNPADQVEEVITAFVSDAILAPHSSLAGRYNVTPEGLRKLKFFSVFLKTYLESYWITLKFLKRHSADPMDTESQLKAIMHMGDQVYRSKEIERKEALSKVSYKNAMKFFSARGITGADDSAIIDFYTGEIRKYLDCL
ncbi:MAG: 1-acyl-sn-glycerol-3-phosphate acyltransferase [Desulfobacterales bacterium]